MSRYIDQLAEHSNKAFLHYILECPARLLKQLSIAAEQFYTILKMPR
jgi:hypothetical protein